jgi:integrase/recombinase XerD
LTGQRIDFERQAIIFRTLKKRKVSRKGEIKAPVFRQVPVPPDLTNSLDLLYDLTNLKKSYNFMDVPLLHKPKLKFPAGTKEA